MIFGDAVILNNTLARLEPMNEAHRDLLWPLANDASIWTWNSAKVADRKDWDTYFSMAMEMKESQKRYPFVIHDIATGRLAGSTSYGNFSIPDNRVEIGWTWLGRDFWGTGLNRACKSLLLGYAFEEMSMLRVELKTDVRNARSRAAILKLGATEEGILRSHMSTHSGPRRDTIYYSILAEEWPEIKHILASH